MRVAGIDQSTNKTGFSVMEKGELIHYELIDLSKHSKDYVARICELEKIIKRKLEEYEVVVVGLEDITASKRGGFTNTRKLAENLGNLKVMLFEKDFAFDTPNPSQWRKGKGFGRNRNEQKTRAIEYVNQTYGLNLRPYEPKSRNNDDDIAESICIAEYLDKKMNK